MPNVKVSGMSCNHCKDAVEKALAVLPGVDKVTVDLLGGLASWTEKPGQSVDMDKVREAINKQGFKAE